MEPQVKTVDKPERASNQLKMVPCLEEAAKKHSKPKAKEKQTETNGLPALSIDDVEKSDSPENLLGSLWKGLSWVLSFSSGQTNQFSTSEGESSSDENVTDTLETIGKGTWVMPVLTTNVTTMWTTTTG
ncbi:hypothetical protein WICPIJ_006423 [Wickerhamomyces pijperi]|uniref:Uncharacterized protein n=1 Tax=Wickerhamomyces pijperi TaxID=599730 RepID=A0A9P8Q4A7_WICPI|nr:hypothetical protein WICPIJ_006423 [Wickerhamomyces pijperi]